MKLLFVGTQQDTNYVALLAPLLAGNPCKLFLGAVTTKREVSTLAAAKGVEAIITTNEAYLKLLSANPKASISNYAGSLFKTPEGIEILVLPALEQLTTTVTGKHLFARYLSKLLNKDSWFVQTPLTWEIANVSSIAALYLKFSTARYISVDIETRKDNLRITCVGYCGVWLDTNGQFHTHSIVIPFTDEFFVAWVAKFNTLAAPKIMQNGQYDCSYFLRFGIPPSNYLFDTLNLFHCWYSELPKRLDFIVSYCLRDFSYWKDESESAACIEDYYFYNAKDTWATANTFLAIMHEAPSWVLENYKLEFPVIFPCLHAAMEGVAIDSAEAAKLEVTETAKLESSLTAIRKSLGSPAFNPGSWQQVAKLYKVLGCGHIKTTNVKDMKKAAALHPLNDWFIGKIVSYREAAKLLSSYLDASLLNGRFMYSLDPAGTDTGRLASGASAFWCGGNIQNTPAEVKSMYLPDAGWLLAEVDYSQSEARCVAFLSGDEKLIEVVQGDKDYHALNAAMFFGVSYESVLAEEAARKKNKTTAFTTRDLSKRVNHGANYNMGAGVLLDTMGTENVVAAKEILKLGRHLGLKGVCEHLLSTYSSTYPAVKGRWYDSIKFSITSTRLLISPLGWTRYCFGNPLLSKQALNSYVAHAPQNLSVSIINKAFLVVWEQFALTGRIRIKAQIHDSILFQYREGDDEVVSLVSKLMEIPVSVRGSDGVTRTMIIPNDVKAGLTRWREI